MKNNGFHYDVLKFTYHGTLFLFISLHYPPPTNFSPSCWSPLFPQIGPLLKSCDIILFSMHLLPPIFIKLLSSLSFDFLNYLISSDCFSCSFDSFLSWKLALFILDLHSFLVYLFNAICFPFSLLLLFVTNFYK